MNKKLYSRSHKIPELYLHACELSCFRRVQLFATPRTAAHHAPLSMGFSRQEHWSRLPFPSPGALPDPGIKPASPAAPVLQAYSHADLSTWNRTCRSPGYFPGLPQWCSGKESTCNAEAEGDVGLIPGLGTSPGGWHGNPLQCSCLENPMDRGAWWATVHRGSQSQTRLK